MKIDAWIVFTALSGCCFSAYGEATVDLAYDIRPPCATNRQLTSGETIAQVLSTDMVALVKSGYTYGPQIHHLINQLHPQIESVTLSDRGILRMILRHRADFFFVAPAEAQRLLELAGADRPLVKVIHFKDPPPGN